jgi:predicted nucleotidyltransferase
VAARRIDHRRLTALRAKTPHLNAVERGCLERYVVGATERLADLDEVWLFGSAARGDMWPDRWPTNSDIDLVVVTAAPVAAGVQEELVNAVYELYLECGRTISPQFRTASELAQARSERTPFAESLGREGVLLWSRAGR